MVFCDFYLALLGIGVVQKPMVFRDFCGATLCGNRRGQGLNTQGFCDFCSSGVVLWYARLLPEPAGRGFDSSLVHGRVMYRNKMQCMCVMYVKQCSVYMYALCQYIYI